jgi:DNA-binding beta-propeller fold protein YncE
MKRLPMMRALLLVSMGPAAQAQNLLVSSANNGQVIQYDWPTGSPIGNFIPPGSGGLVQPFGMAYGPNTDLFVCSYDGDAILEYDGSTGAFVSTFIPSGGILDQPMDVVWAPDGTVLITSLTAGCVLRYTGGGTFLAASPCLGAGGVGTGLTFAPNGNLFVCWFRISPALAAVYEYTGPNHDIFVKSYTGGLGVPSAATIGPDGNLYVSDFPSDRVLRFSTATGGLIGTFVVTGSGGLDGPRDLAFGPNGNLFVISNYTNAVLEYNGTTGAFIGTFVAAGSGGLSGPWGFVFRGAPPLTCADDCLDANPLTGTGVFPFDNTNATTDGPDHAACLSGGSPSIANDCWWCWTAPCSGRVVVRTCNETTVDTKIAVYAGCACPPTDANLLDCDDNGCGLQSLVSFFVTAGSDYLIRIGTPPGSPGGLGAFRILCPPTGADFGDAPDGILSCQGAGTPSDPQCLVPAVYPTIYETANAALNRTAPFHRPIGAELLDDFYLGGAPSYEAGAYQACCDWISCGIDAPPWAFPADDCPWVLCLNPP